MHDLAGGRGDALDLVQDALRIEGEAASVATRRAGHTQAWLFRAQAEPLVVDIADLPVLTSADENFVWIDLHDFTREDLERIARLVHLDPTAVQAAGAAWQRPRLNMFASQFFVIVTIPWLDAPARRVEAAELDLFVGRNFLVTAHKHPLPFSDRIMARASHNPALVQLDSVFMLYLVLDELLA